MPELIGREFSVSIKGQGTGKQRRDYSPFEESYEESMSGYV